MHCPRLIELWLVSNKILIVLLARQNFNDLYLFNLSYYGSDIYDSYIIVGTFLCRGGGKSTSMVKVT